MNEKRRKTAEHGPETDTICAIATPAGKGGIGIVKISGPDALALGLSVFSKKSSLERQGKGEKDTAVLNTEYVPRHMYHGYIWDNHSGRAIDEVLFVYMKGPNSYTGEDVVEIHAHSGTAVLETILKKILMHGGRCAEPGEFTQRAFLNNRIDLTQAEGVIDLINARTASALKIAANLVSGEFGRQIREIRSGIIELLTLIEAGIDFPDEVSTAGGIDQKFIEIQQDQLARMERLIQQFDSGRCFREGFRLALVGRPNVGKSSLMNRLLGEERAIVTDIPGTTRDLIHESVSINGAPIVLTDTAGIQSTENPIERIGIERTKTQIAESDIVLFIVDAHLGIRQDELGWFDAASQKKLLIVINKIDLIKNSCEKIVSETFGNTPVVCVSAKTGLGIEDLWEAIKNLIFKDKDFDLSDTVIPNIRQKKGLEMAVVNLFEAFQAYQDDFPLELVAIDLKESVDQLGAILGLNAREDVLDHIFREFCIGK